MTGPPRGWTLHPVGLLPVYQCWTDLPRLSDRTTGTSKGTKKSVEDRADLSRTGQPCPGERASTVVRPRCRGRRVETLVCLPRRTTGLEYVSLHQRAWAERPQPLRRGEDTTRA